MDSSKLILGKHSNKLLLYSCHVQMLCFIKILSLTLAPSVVGRRAGRKIEHHIYSDVTDKCRSSPTAGELIYY